MKARGVGRLGQAGQTVISVAILLGLHALLQRWLLASSAVTAILALGPDTPVVTLAAVILFVLLRLLLILLGPGLVVAAIALRLTSRARLDRHA